VYMNCKKCGAHYPNIVVVEGKARNFQRRKYCLKCSPFGSGNTQKLELLDENRPSAKSRRHTSWITQQRKSRQERKDRLIKMLGGKCIMCGYKRCSAALSFHHRKPEEKSFNIASKGLLGKWEDVLAEAKKCDLLCLNCHTERHWPNEKRHCSSRGRAGV